MFNSLNYDKPNFLKDRRLIFIDNDIFIIRNFINKKMQEMLLNYVNDFKDEDWLKHGNYKIGDLPAGSFAFNKVSPPVKNIEYLNDEILKLFAPEYWNVSSLFLNRLRVNERIPTQTIGNEFGIHYVSNIPLGQWSGGEVCFLDKNIEISLNSGDLLFFDANYSVDLKKITDGIRYSHVDLIIKNPPRLII